MVKFLPCRCLVRKTRCLTQILWPCWTISPRWRFWRCHFQPDLVKLLYLTVPLRKVNIVLILEKCETKASCPCFTSARNCSAYTVHCGLFPPAFVSSQIAQVDRLRILERVISVQVRSAAKSLQLHFFFLLKIEDLEKEWLFTPSNNCSGASSSPFSKLFTGSQQNMAKYECRLNESKWHSASGSSIMS